jgi:sialate O-acetylesterase
MRSWNNSCIGIVTACLISLISRNELSAKVVLPNIFDHNMVVQQKSVLRLWGVAKPQKLVKIKASWDNKEYKVHTYRDGKWSINIPTPAASFNQHSIQFNDGQPTLIKGILFGDVWFCSGQSNMEMTFKGFTNQPIDQAQRITTESSTSNAIRMFKVKRNAAESPSTDGDGKWYIASPTTLEQFSVVAYTFAKKLHNELNIPIGIINSSWGGSSVEGWMNKDLVDNYTDMNLNEDIPDSENWRKPCVMYNGMLKPFVKVPVKGFVWYQGEANIDRYSTYANKLTDMINLWRFEWKLGKLPFYLVEIAPYLYEHPVNAAKLREAQQQTVRQTEQSWIVCTNDLVRPDESAIVHPSQKEPIGQRLANSCLKNTYGQRSLCVDSPQFSGITIDKKKAVLQFDNTVDGLKSDGEISGFEVADTSRVFYPATATFGKDKLTIEVTHPNGLTIESVRYCFKNYSLGNVRNSCGLPLFDFRTDQW